MAQELERSRLVERVLEFCRLLRHAGLGVTPRAAIDAARSIETIPLDRETFRSALQANLVGSVDEIETFGRLFREFWENGGESPGPPGGQTDLPRSRRPDEAVFVPVPTAFLEVEPGGDARLPGGDRSASEVDLVTHKDFAEYTGLDALRARRIVARMAPALATVPGRRMERAQSGEVDMRRTVQALRRMGGDAVGLARRRRKQQRLRVVALCDVSGSMDVYSAFLLQFLFALQRQHGLVRTFVFSTQLEDVTAALRQKRFDQALASIERQVRRWSGGTSIGESLAQFNARFGSELLTPRTIVLVLSDGWERADPSVLARELEFIRRRVRQVIWLNPLKGRQGYEPLAAGMAAALPHVDQFLAANSLESLERLSRILARS